MISRLAIVAGSAALVALAIRGPLADRVARLLEAPIGDLASVIPVSASEAVPAAIDEAPEPVMVDAPELVIATPKKKIAIVKKKSEPSAFVVTKEELESAVASKGHGARASVVKEGLALHHVGAFSKFGVAEGDVLVSANGHSLRTADDALATLGALGNSRSIVVVLRRGESSYAVPITLVGD